MALERQHEALPGEHLVRDLLAAVFEVNVPEGKGDARSIHTASLPRGSDGYTRSLWYYLVAA